MMTTKKKIMCALCTVGLALLSLPTSAQDLIARQAPTDRLSRAVDTLQLQSLLAREMESAFSDDLYSDWSSDYTFRETTLPETYTIDLRGFCMPTTSRAITSNFGYRWRRQHKGIDIKVYVGDTIRAAFSGKVRVVKYDRRGFGNYVVIRHSNGLETTYGHLSKQLVKENQVVKAGEPIGLGGNTGRSTGSHLHFETRLCGVALNPALMFDFRAQDVVGDYYVFNRKTYAQESQQANRLRGMKGNGGYTEEDVRGRALTDEERASIKKAQSTTTQANYHKVQKGETLSSIARKRGTTVAKLCQLNNISTKTVLRVGMILRCS